MPLHETTVCAIGEPLIAFISRQADRSLIEADSFDACVVGAEINAAIGLARLGHRVEFIGRVGTDAFGSIVKRRLREEGVSTTWLVDDPRPTGLLFRNLRSTSSAEVVYRRSGSAGAALTYEDITPALAQLPADGLVLLSGVTAAVCPEAVAALIAAGVRGNARLCVDLNFRSRLWAAEEAQASLARLSSVAWMVVGGDEEAKLVTGASDLDGAANALLARGATVVVLRHDTVAASWYEEGLERPATVWSRTVPATDPVGAGDAFMAGLVSGLIEFGRSDPRSCLERAHRCGAAVIGTVGDTGGALFRSELRSLAGVDVVR